MRTILLIASVALIRVASAEPCPEDFDKFKGAFERSVEFQVAHSKYPMSFQYLEASASAEPKPVEVAVKLDDLGQFPTIAFPSPAQRAQESMQETVTAPDAKTRVVRLWVQGSDAELKYVFKRTSACWELIRVEDRIF